MTRSWSIRAKLIAVVMATTCASLSLMAFVLGIFELVSHRKAMATEIAAVSQIIGANSTAALTFSDEAAAREILRAIGLRRDIQAACLYDAGGRLFSSFHRPGVRTDCPPSPSPDGAAFDSDTFVQSSAVMLEAERVGTLRLVATQANLWRHMQLFCGVLAVTVVVSLVAGLLLSSRLQRVVSRPISQLASTARRISEQRDYTLRAPQGSQDEVGVAVTAFNSMLDRIQDGDRAIREAEQKSREQAQFLGSILDNMGEGMVVVDRDANVLVWNAAATRIVGPSPVGQPLSQWAQHFKLVHTTEEGLVPIAEAPLALALRGEVVDDYELRLEQTEAQGRRWVTGTAQAMRDEHGEVFGAVSVFRDVTQQKQAELDLRASEAQLRQAQKMDAVGQLAGGIAHDFNNLLTVICGYSNFALNAMPPGDPARADIEEVLGAGQRAATLTRQLLAFSRRQVLAPQRLDLNAVVHASWQMLRRLIGENVEFSVVYGAHLGAVLADPGQLDQVILNLVVNARDAMPQGGKLTLETGNAELDERYAREHVGARAGSYVRLKVTDTGVGMTPEVQARIFEPFFTTKEVGRGTGLGLSTVYGIIQQSGGHIEVTSVAGEGTTFTIYLARASAAEASASSNSASASVPRGTETILLVEDEPPVRNLARQILTGLGYKVLVASDGAEALEVQAGHDGPVHLLISDVVMPRLGGGELARRLLQRQPTLPIVFFSGYAADANLDPILSLGKPTIISKPFTAEELGRAAREALDRARATGAAAKSGASESAPSGVSHDS
jgi:signal transduction histidine kinase/HAMP domain-containing protein/ActR/RegA family two-component response regulator